MSILAPSRKPKKPKLARLPVPPKNPLPRKKGEAVLCSNREKGRQRFKPEVIEAPDEIYGVNPTHIQLLGLPCAVLLSVLGRLQQGAKAEMGQGTKTVTEMVNGKEVVVKWFYCPMSYNNEKRMKSDKTYRPLQKYLPWMSQQSLSQHISKLNHLGVLTLGRANKMKRDCTKWYHLHPNIMPQFQSTSLESLRYFNARDAQKVGVLPAMVLNKLQVEDYLQFKNKPNSGRFMIVRTVRLAEDLSSTRETVKKALDILEKEGYVESMFFTEKYDKMGQNHEVKAYRLLKSNPITTLKARGFGRKSVVIPLNTTISSREESLAAMERLKSEFPPATEIVTGYTKLDMLGINFLNQQRKIARIKRELKEDARFEKEQQNLHKKYLDKQLKEKYFAELTQYHKTKISKRVKLNKIKKKRAITRYRLAKELQEKRKSDRDTVTKKPNYDRPYRNPADLDKVKTIKVSKPSYKSEEIDPYKEFQKLEGLASQVKKEQKAKFKSEMRERDLEKEHEYLNADLEKLGLPTLPPLTEVKEVDTRTKQQKTVDLMKKFDFSDLKQLEEEQIKARIAEEVQRRLNKQLQDRSLKVSDYYEINPQTGKAIPSLEANKKFDNDFWKQSEDMEKTIVGRPRK